MVRMRTWGTVLVLALAACSDATEPERSIAGRWAGLAVGINFDFVVTDQAGAIRGTGTALAAALSLALSLEGTHVHPDVSITMSAPGYEPINFSGTVTGRQMSGTLNGSGFHSEQLTLTMR